MEIERYIHFNTVVSVQSHLKGKHKDHCLCWQNCLFFKPSEADNCPLAQELYEYDVKYNMVTPVWECAKYEESK